MTDWVVQCFHHFRHLILDILILHISQVCTRMIACSSLIAARPFKFTRVVGTCGPRQSVEICCRSTELSCRLLYQDTINCPAWYPQLYGLMLLEVVHHPLELSTTCVSSSAQFWIARCCDSHRDFFYNQNDGLLNLQKWGYHLFGWCLVADWYLRFCYWYAHPV